MLLLCLGTQAKKERRKNGKRDLPREKKRKGKGRMTEGRKA